MDNASAAGYMGASPNSFKIVGDPIGNDQFGFILKKGSDLVAPFNAAIASIKADGTLDALNKKWFFDYNQQVARTLRRPAVAAPAKPRREFPFLAARGGSSSRSFSRG